MINHYYGGTLEYYIKNHPIGSHLVVYQDQDYMVNSYHHDGITKEGLSSQLKAIVYSKQDQLVEGYVNRADNISTTLGVQWHPERDQFPIDLFKILWKKIL
jgi:gamma-glutamyl-gamma-aminobutyrate hydrolase PuuD